ncbi:MAG: amidohydrolase [Methylocystis sp.]|uniref:amidohydrolase n=1 Tax=Methylocystis sp. TaxID=1911079 RepID=UPI003DA6A5F8
MCRGCFNPLILNGEVFVGGGGRVFADVAPGPTRRNFIACSVAAAAAASVSGAQAAPAGEAGAEVIFKGGKIIPLPGASPVKALAIGGGRILELGSESAVNAVKTKNTQIVDLQGRVLMPGLIDPHNHTILSALIFELLTDVGYVNFPTRGKLLDELRALAARTPPGQWIACSNFDNLLQGGDLSRDELDGVSTNHPILVWYTNGHDACVNSAGLKAANIPEDIGPLPGGGHFGRDDNGKLNGRAYEESAVMKVVFPALPKITPALASKAIGDYLRSAAAVGNTTVHEPGTLPSRWVADFAKLSNHVACRTSASLMYDDMKGFEPYRSLGIGAKATQLPNSLFTLYGVKIVGDGSNQTETGAQTQPYLDTDSKGAPNYTAAQMKDMVAAVKAAGLPVLIHCNGDYTIDISLDAIEAAYGGSTAQGINRIEHSTMARPDQILRMKKLNVQPSFLMNHVRFYGAAYRDQIFGRERAAFTDPAGACVKAELPFTLHTDAPCSPLGPLALVSTAVTRRCDIDGSTIGRDQAVTLDQALRAVTIDAARQIGMGDRIGSLEKGKEADLVLLESDPYKTAPEKLGAIKVSETWVAGERKYGA